VLRLVGSAVNKALPAFAAERRAAAPVLLGARRCPSIARRSEANPPHAAAAVE